MAYLELGLPESHPSNGKKQLGVVHLKVSSNWTHPTQSGTEPNLVAKILATNFGFFFVILVMFSKICSVWV